MQICSVCSPATFEWLCKTYWRALCLWSVMNRLAITCTVMITVIHCGMAFAWRHVLFLWEGFVTPLSFCSWQKLFVCSLWKFSNVYIYGLSKKLLALGKLHNTVYLHFQLHTVYLYSMEFWLAHSARKTAYIIINISFFEVDIFNNIFKIKYFGSVCILAIVTVLLHKDRCKIAM